MMVLRERAFAMVREQIFGRFPLKQLSLMSHVIGRNFNLKSVNNYFAYRCTTYKNTECF